jgi:hypothetical protein
VEIYKNLNSFFSETLRDLPCSEETRAYIISIFYKYRMSNADLSKDNLTLLFAQARFNQDFLTYQNIGDWIFYSKSMYPEHLHRASEDYYYNIARLSYYSCYKLIDRKWKLYEQLADECISLTKEAQSLLHSNSSQNIYT